MGIVYGGKESAQEIIVGYDTVYVHTNIEDISDTDEMGREREMYRYNEVQYTKDEYIALMIEKQKQLDDQLTSVELVLCDMYEEALYRG
jgi:hypothetical protein